MKKNSLLSMFRYTWKYSPNRRLFLLFVSFSLIANIFYLVIPLFIGKIFNSIQFSPSDPRIVIHIIWGMLLVVVFQLLNWAFHGPSRVMENRHAFLTRNNYRNQLFSKVLGLSVTWHKNHHSGDTIDKVNKASNNLFSFSGDIYIFMDGLVNLVGSIVILAFFDLKSIVIAFIITLIALVTIVYFDRKLAEGYKKVYKDENFLASAIHDYISNILTVVTLRLRKRALREIVERSEKPYSKFIRNAKMNEVKWFLINIYIIVGTALILVGNAYFSYKNKGIVILGDLFILYKYLEGIGSTFYNFAWKWGETVSQNSAMQQAEIINKEYENTAKGGRYFLSANWQTLQVKELYFDYDQESILPEVRSEGGNLSDVSFSLTRGAKVAFIGESGSGKSTVFSLLRGLHQPNQVKVYCDGKKMPHGLEHLNQQSLLIPQEPELFNSTIQDNITMGLKVSEEKILEAIKLACFDKVLVRLKKGLKTNVLEKGVSLSGGEKQRLALARGLLVANNYDFILLDEPTSSVDSENELNIYKNIFENFAQKTIISSIHRLHLLRHFDYIYHFRNGKIVAEGTFTQLLEDQEFQKIWEKYNREVATD